MIESKYYRQDLIRLVNKLSPKRHPPKWKEKGMVIMEKRIVLALYIIRKLIENDKVTNKTKDLEISVTKTPRTTKEITPINFWDLDEIYDNTKSAEAHVDIFELSNICIHSKVLFLKTDQVGNWDLLEVTSDFKQEQFLLGIRCHELIRILELVIKDYPRTYNYRWNQKKGRWDKEIY